jgi:hypothetical protein
MKSKRSIQCIVASIFIILCAMPGSAQYRILPGDTGANGCSGKQPARICLGKTGTAHCYATQSTKNYVFGLEPKAVDIGNLDGQPLTLFSATFSGCGSATLTGYSLLAVRSGEFANLLPTVGLSNQSELKVWHLSQISSFPIVVTADFIWDFDAKETHFAPHRYEIAAYVFDIKSGSYRQEMTFKTEAKFPGLDDVDNIAVLENQRPIIIAKLRASADKAAPGR